MTFPIEKCVFFDYETRHGVNDLKVNGTYRYASTATAIILTYAIGNGPVEAVHCIDGLSWGELPSAFRAAVLDPLNTLIAWNAGFDRAIHNYALFDSPFLPPHRVVDAMAQAMAANLPAALGLAIERLERITGKKFVEKRKSGAGLIKLFSAPNGPRPEQFPEQWQEFLDYAKDDVAGMRDVWQSTNALPIEEWQVYWANERLNERGMGVDAAFAARAAELARQDVFRTNARLSEITNGAIRTVFQHVVIARWVFDRLPDEHSRDIMVTALLEPEDMEEDDEGVEMIEKISIERTNVERLLLYLRSIEYGDEVLMEVLELREFGASAAPKKFQAILNQQAGGRLRGQIVFNGAAQTGRFSGKGVQVQNNTRSTLGLDDGDDYGTWEAPTVELITDGCTLDQLAAFGRTDVVPSRKLALTVRPAIVAADGKTLIKSDYAQVEARVLPWLSGTDLGEIRLDAFRAIDTDPDAPDVYKVTASGMFGVAVEDVSKEQRTGGKITDLACQFGGREGALMSMGVKYRLYFTPEKARELADRWRAANPWAPAYWGKHTSHESYGLWGAVMRAYENPGTVQTAGRISFVYDWGYLGGSLFMILPSMRVLTYPYCREREFERKDRRTGKVIEVRRTLTFLRPDGYRALYGGLVAENATQATAADLLRGSLVDIDEEGLIPLVLHAHDELVGEIDDDAGAIAHATEHMEEVMLRDRGWNEGLPLGVDTTVRWYYSASRVKSKENA